MRGQYSTKSDVFSFGVLIIEIVTGQRNNRPYLFEQNEDIISTVWRRWSDGTVAKMIDHSLGKNYPEAEVLKCINIGLLCLQENPVNRPTMADIMEQGRLKNELVLVAKLQHKNLVRLVDVCLEEHDKMVIYEYMPNRSLDTILFDHASSLLDWGRRLKIIHGIARHLQYLHEESRLKIIYRDLKTSK
ncbi:Os07g0540500 [Oryza sativa Japonica Group]|uniref:non-specific serine/threonine protein kinase n=1 Tax=Oryza sativa subsp. japonica TaxID=39947 RepID=A0A0P0X7K2_ORYSJ|nr:hypothetical protein EE612_039816 [Oryza sativa]BAT01961.1 Os07g0540500 [Oryza sativa Japonica Group]